MPKTRSDKPNVIVFFTDQQRWDSTGVHGNPLDLTPNFDRMAQNGTHVQHSITCQPVCGPARSCLQTGLYATTTGCFRNGIPLPKDTPTLADYFKDAGYTTGYIGKWHLAADGQVGGVRPEDRGGYDYWLASNVLEFTSDAYQTTLFDNDQNPVKLPGYRVDACNDAVIRYVDENQNGPFFLFTSFIEPHHQNHIDDYPPPDGYRERYAGRWTPPDLAALGGTSQQHLGGYWGMVKRLDEALGRLNDALKSLGLLENTILLFTSDHACHFKTRNSEYKRSCHESSVRVPTALQGPGFDGGGRLQEMISLIDLPPTLLDAAGIHVPDEMQGRSIMPLINGTADDWPEEAFIQISEAQVGRSVRTKRWKYAVDAPDKSGGKDSGSDVYVEQYLYDLQCDPYELSNLIEQGSHRIVADTMKERLIRRMVEAGETAPKIVNAERKKSGQRKVSEEEARM
ncbi:MAG: sulfatase-like hydrolase/transferase [Planctomycetota bacterium]|nr:sulfatase-like hydrolase/transferase [Planctomycetota bacterium]